MMERVGKSFCFAPQTPGADHPARLGWHFVPSPLRSESGLPAGERSLARTLPRAIFGRISVGFR